MAATIALAMSGPMPGTVISCRQLSLPWLRSARSDPGKYKEAWRSAHIALRPIAGSRAGTDKPIRFIQIGTAGGANIALPGAILRSTPIELKGSGLGSVPINRIVGAIKEVLHAAVAGRFEIAIKPVPLSEVEQAWSGNAFTTRVVFTIGEKPG